MARLTGLAVFVVLFASSLLAEETRIRVNALERDRVRVESNTRRPELSTEEVARHLRDAVLRSTPVSARHEITALKAAPLSELATRPDVTISWRSDGTPRQIRGELQQSRLSSNASHESPIDTARQFLRDNRGLLKLDDPDAELVVTDRSTDELGRTHVRFDQVARGIPVWPSELIVHLDQAGNVDLVDGAYVPTPRRLPRVPLIGTEQAIARARGSECANAATSIPELIVFAKEGRRPRLAWKMTVHESLATRWLVVVDALSGVVLDRFNSINTANVIGSGRDLRGITRTLNVWQQGTTFLLLDTTKAMFDPTSTPPSPQSTRGGIFVADSRNLPATNRPQNFPPDLSVTTSSSASTWPVADTVSASFLISQTYDYYLNVHQRNSIDGRKGTIMGIVRLGQGFANAFWDGEQQLMVFGDADTYAGSLDVVAHEMTHGVTGNTSNLVYQGQSGALNEALSDIFGEMAEFRTYGANDWLLGTHMREPIRSMSDPTRFGDPAKMSQFLVTTSDNGGVHTNSGIINRAYYLLAEGMSGAIGKSAAERIFYRANTQHLTKNSQFIDARLAAIASADELFGAGSTQSKKTGEAFDAVEIFAAAATPSKPGIPVVQGSDSTLFLYKSGTVWGLARRETPPDPVQGVALSKFSVGESRPAVTLDGKIAAFVDSIDDLCLISTAGGAEEVCAGFPEKGIRVSSVGMSPDGNRFGIVLLGDSEPEDQIIVVDIATSGSVQIDLSTPVLDSDFGLSSIDFADAMTFTQDGRFIIYDALTEVFANNAPWAAWAIYAYDLDEEEFYTVIPPIEGLDIGYPALGHTSDDLMTFEAYDAARGTASVYNANLANGDLVLVGTQSGVESSPSFTGDDRAVIYANGASNTTGSMLLRQNLATDHLTPSGSASTWLDQGRFGLMYRRGTYAGPLTVPGAISFGSSTFNVSEGAVATVTVMRTAGVKGAVSVSYNASSGSATSGTDFFTASGTLTWADGEDGAKSFQVRTRTDTLNEGTETATLTLSSPSGGASLATPTSSTLLITNVTGTRKRRSTKH
jgi:bacillolysin